MKVKQIRYLYFPFEGIAMDYRFKRCSLQHILQSGLFRLCSPGMLCVHLYDEKPVSHPHGSK